MKALSKFVISQRLHVPSIKHHIAINMLLGRLIMYLVVVVECHPISLRLLVTPQIELLTVGFPELSRAHLNKL